MNAPLRKGPSGPEMFPVEGARPYQFLMADGSIGDVYGAAVAAITNLYVDPSVGSDENSGTDPNEPLATLDEALKIASVSTVKTIVECVQGDYSADMLRFDVFPVGVNVRFAGETLLSTATISGIASNVYTFSPSPGWVANSLAGKQAKAEDGSIRTIVWNTADTLTLGNTFASASNGQTVQVYNPTSTVTMPSGAQMFGGSGFNYVELTNVRIPTTSTELYFNKSWRLASVAIEKSGASRLTVFMQGDGWIVTGNSAQGNLGRGFALLNVSGGTNPTLSIQDSRRNSLRAVVVGELEFKNAITTFSANWIFVNRNRAVGVPHGGVRCYQNGSAFLGNITVSVLAGDNAFDASYVGSMEIFFVVQHLQGALFATARYSSTIRIFSNPVVTGPAPQITSRACSALELAGVDGSTLGAATAGQSPGLTRAAGAWAVGESILQQADPTSATTLRNTLPGDGSVVLRTT